MLDVEGIYRGRAYVARLTGDGVWVVRCDGPVFVFPALAGEQADAVRIQVERLFDALPGPRVARDRNAPIQAGSSRATAGTPNSMVSGRVEAPNSK